MKRDKEARVWTCNEVEVHFEATYFNRTFGCISLSHRLKSNAQQLVGWKLRSWHENAKKLISASRTDTCCLAPWHFVGGGSPLGGDNERRTIRFEEQCHHCLSIVRNREIADQMGGKPIESRTHLRPPVGELPAWSASDLAALLIHPDQPENGFSTSGIRMSCDSPRHVDGLKGPVPLQLHTRVFDRLSLFDSLDDTECPCLNIGSSHPSSLLEARRHRLYPKWG